MRVRRVRVMRVMGMVRVVRVVVVVPPSLEMHRSLHSWLGTRSCLRAGRLRRSRRVLVRGRNFSGQRPAKLAFSRQLAATNRVEVKLKEWVGRFTVNILLTT